MNRHHILSETQAEVNTFIRCIFKEVPLYSKSLFLNQAICISICLFIGLFPLEAADLNLNPSKELITITSEWPNYDRIKFTNGESIKNMGGPNNEASKFGVRFHNLKTNTVNSAITADGNSCPILGVTGTGTVLRYSGVLKGDGGGSYTHIRPADGGKFILAADAKLDFVNNAYYTRQIWVLGDGTGVFEVEPDFIADKTNGGTVASGIGSYRFSNCTFISHSSQSLPQHAWPSCKNCPQGQLGYNGHLVFEKESGSRWIVTTESQTYPAAIWCWADVTIETRQNLIHTGFNEILESNDNGNKYTYNLAGAFQTLDTGITITKEGPDALILKGEQAYFPGAKLKIMEGTVEFDCDATGGILRPGSDTGGQELNLEIGNQGFANITSQQFRIKNLSMQEKAKLELSVGSRIEISDTAKIQGSFTLSLKQSIIKTIKVGDSLEIFKWGKYRSGSFSSLQLPQGFIWDSSNLYTTGNVKAVSETSAIIIQPMTHQGSNKNLFFLNYRSDGKHITQNPFILH